MSLFPQGAIVIAGVMSCKLIAALHVHGDHLIRLCPSGFMNGH